MEQEFEVGDRFTLEFEVTGRSWQWHESQSPGGAERAFPPSDMRYAKLIQPAATEPPKLDVTKRMRNKHDGEEVLYIGKLSNGMIVAEEMVDGNPVASSFEESELENIPEPKRTTTQIVELVNFTSGPQIVMKSAGPFYVNVASHAKISYTDGEGWSIEEMEGEG
jgi:hypothetical protein